MNDPRSAIPSVDRVMALDAVRPLVDTYGRPRVVDAVRAAVDAVRERLDAGVGQIDAGSGTDDPSDPHAYVTRAERQLRDDDVPGLRPVVNATGVVLHTNLGRAPLADAATRAMHAAATGYSNLEYDVEGGVRGSRYDHCSGLLSELTGAEDALVVNNAAAGLVLALNSFGRERGVVVSRGELVEIGGGFRIPEVLERSGARMVEVGSTNRTRLADYRLALEEGGGAALLKVHRSNFRITGFTEEASLAELAPLARERGIPLIYDLGSGLMVDPGRVGLPDEPTVRRAVAAGSDLVIVSGDKLLGGPQAGVVVGRAPLIAAMRRNPLCRALRVDKVTLAGMEATLRLYRDPDRVVETVPVLRMLALPAASIRARVETLAGRVRDRAPSDWGVDVVPTAGAVGGGTFPDVEIASWALEVTPPGGADGFAHALRAGRPPVVGRIVDEAVRLDLRTVPPDEDEVVARRLVEILSSAQSGPADAR